MAKSSYHVLLWLCCMTVFLLGQLREVNGQCLQHQKSLLIKLNHSLITQNDGTDDLNPRRLTKWDFNRDCCGWPGVTCSRNGYVTGLDLSFEGIVDGLNNLSPLFDLQYLTSLDLAGNVFQWRPDMSSGFERLVNMIHLNMSWSSFTGRFPIEISNMTRLVSLDLSSFFNVGLSYEQFNLSMLVGNMSKLTELRLDWASDLVMQEESDWSQVLSSSLSHLQVLSLKYCRRSLPSSLSKLTSLTSLDLSYNNLNGSIPSSLGELKILSILKLGSCNLKGFIPNSLAKLTTLTYMDLSDNQLSGAIPNSLAKLTTLTYMDLSGNQLSGAILNSFAKLTTLTYMDLAVNQLSGTIPSLSRSKNLTYLNFGYNQLTGSIIGTQWSDMSQLEHIRLSSNSLSGSIPTSLFGIPTLKELYFSKNSFVNFTDEPVNTSSSLLEVLDLGRNELRGLFPSFVFELKAMQSLDVGSNNFSGIFYMDSLQQLRNISTLILSYNYFSIDLGQHFQNFSYSFDRLGLASCKLKVFPKFLQSDIKYKFLDLAANEIRGEIPVWLWSNLEFNGYLNLSHNQLETFESHVGHFYHCEASLIDLSSNRLHGNIPKFSVSYILYLSNNMFDSTIFSSINMSTLTSLFASNNHLQGSISESLCNGATLKVLHLSNNFLSGILPSCLTQMPNLFYLNLKNNSISGTIPDSFPLGCSLQAVILNNNSLLGSIPKSLGNCTNLEILDLGNNKLHEYFLSGIFQKMPSLNFLNLKNNNINGKIPDTFLRDCNLKTVILNGNSLLGNIPKSLGKCTGLEVLDMGSNKLHDKFPCWMSNISTLRVLVLKSNMLEGSIICPGVNVSWPSLQILDLQNNQLTGMIPVQLANLNFLSVLNLSFNQLEGMIPNGGQMQTFSNGSFMHNKGLCGFPLNKNCAEKDGSMTLPKPATLPRPAEKFTRDVLISAEVGYAVGLGLIIMPLIFWPKWRMRLFQFTDNLTALMEELIS